MDEDDAQTAREIMEFVGERLRAHYYAHGLPALLRAIGMRQAEVDEVMTHEITAARNAVYALLRSRYRRRGLDAVLKEIGLTPSVSDDVPAGPDPQSG